MNFDYYEFITFESKNQAEVYLNNSRTPKNVRLNNFLINIVRNCLYYILTFYLKNCKIIKLYFVAVDFMPYKKRDRYF